MSSTIHDYPTLPGQQRVSVAATFTAGEFKTLIISAADAVSADLDGLSREQLDAVHRGHARLFAEADDEPEDDGGSAVTGPLIDPHGTHPPVPSHLVGRPTLGGLV